MTKLGENILENNNLTTEERRELFNNNYRLVYYMMKNIKINKDNPNYEDFLQEGFIGLNRASELFKPELGYKFSTYAVYWIRAKIMRLLRSTIKANSLPLDSGEYILAPTISIDSLCDETDENSSKIIDLIGYDPSDINDKDIDSENKINIVYQNMNDIFVNLSKENKYRLAWYYALIMYYRILSNDPLTLEHLGRILNISRERVRQLENQLFDELYLSMNLYRINNASFSHKNPKRKKSLFGVDTRKK